jgi:hypothetical protein
VSFAQKYCTLKRQISRFSAVLYRIRGWLTQSVFTSKMRILARCRFIRIRPASVIAEPKSLLLLVFGAAVVIWLARRFRAEFHKAIGACHMSINHPFDDTDRACRQLIPFLGLRRAANPCQSDAPSNQRFLPSPSRGFCEATGHVSKLAFFSSANGVSLRAIFADSSLLSVGSPPRRFRRRSRRP